MTDRDTLRERLDAVEGQLPDRRARTASESHKEAVRAALGWRYDNYDAADADSGNTEAVFSEAAENVEEPHATTLREMLGREGGR